MNASIGVKMVVGVALTSGWDWEGLGLHTDALADWSEIPAADGKANILKFAYIK